MPTSSKTPTTLAALAQHAADTPEEPWLFYRQHHDWQWHSWSQVAHQVIEGAGVLLCSSAFAASGGRVAYADALDPDALALDLAICLAGGQAVPVAAEDSPVAGTPWARIGLSEKTDSPAPDGHEVLVLPGAPSRLSRWTTDLAALRVETPEQTLEARPERPVQGSWFQARQWREFFPKAPARKRPIVLASASVDPATRRTLLAWTLLEAAAWVLEKDPERFVTAVLRNRPTLVLAPASDAGLLALAFQERRFRRWHRLQAVVLTDDEPGEIALEKEWGEIGVPVLRLTGHSDSLALRGRG